MIDADELRNQIMTNASASDMPSDWYKGVQYAVYHIVHAPTIEPEPDGELDFVQEHKKLPIALIPERKTVKEVEELLCLLPKIESADGQDYVQLSDVLETIHRYAIEPERTSGKWMLMDDCYTDFFICNQCGKQNDYKSNFCPSCGADMMG